MYHSVARVYIAQKTSKLQRIGRPRPCSFEVFLFANLGSRHGLWNNLTAFMHTLYAHVYNGYRFDTKNHQKIWSQPNFLEVTWPWMDFLLVIGTNRCGRCINRRCSFALCYTHSMLQSPSSATICIKKSFWPKLPSNWSFMITWPIRNWVATNCFLLFLGQNVVNCIPRNMGRA